MKGSNICLLIALLARKDQGVYYVRFIRGGVNEQARAQITLQVMFELETSTSLMWPAASVLGFTLATTRKSNNLR